EVPEDGGVHVQPGGPAGADEQPRGASQPAPALLGEGALQVAAAAVGGAGRAAGLGPLVAAGPRGGPDIRPGGQGRPPTTASALQGRWLTVGISEKCPRWPACRSAQSALVRPCRRLDYYPGNKYNHILSCASGILHVGVLEVTHDMLGPMKQLAQ